MAVDGSGNTYIADTNNHTIRKITSAGVVSTIAGLAGTSGSANGNGNSGSTTGPARFNSPEGIAVNAAGTTLWVADTFNHVIRAIDLTTSPASVTTLAGAAGTASFVDDPSGANARFNFPVGIVFDGTKLYVADQSNQNIRVVTTSGVVTTLAGPNSLGTAGTSGYVDSNTANAVRFKNPFQLAVDNTRVFVADKGNHAIRVVTIATGAVATLAGTGTSGSADAPSGPATSATFNGPGGIAVDSTGSSAATAVYVADSVNDTIRKITLSSGIVSTIAGSTGVASFADGLGTAARFSGPLGVALDSGGNLYVADTLNHLVRKASPTAAPAITSANSSTFVSGSAGTFTVTATASPAATFSVSSGSLPAGVTLSTNAGANTATLAGTPTASGTFSFTIQASNGVGSAATQSFTLTVQQVPVFTSAASTAFAVNTAGSFQVSATGFPAPTFSIFSGTLPSSVATLNSSGLLTATPPSSTSGSPFTFTIRAHNAAGDTDQSFSLTVQNGAAISVQPTNQTVIAGQTATFSVTAGGNPAPTSYQWYRQISGTTGFVALTDGGVYSGATTATLAVSNTTLQMDQDQFECVVSNGVGSPVTSQPAVLRVGTVPAFTSAATTTFVVNTAGTFQVAASGSPAPTFSITAGTLPSSVANLNSAGLITAAPPSSTTGTPFTFTITASNLVGTATQSFTLNVSAVPVTPTVTSQPTNQTAGVGQNVTFTVTATGDAPLSYQWQRQATGTTGFVNLSEGAPFSGTTSATLTITGTAAWMSGDAYQCVITNAIGSTTSSVATLTLSVGTTFSTLAGQAGIKGALDGTGTAAQFNAPTSVAVDSSGNVYVADASNHVIRKITPGGVVSTIAGLAGTAGSADGPALSARFSAPQGVAIDSFGNIYVADSLNHTIRVISSAGIVSTLAGSPGIVGSADGILALGVSTARFTYPASLTIDSQGNLYVADTLNHTIRKVTATGIVTTIAGSPGIRGTSDGSLSGGVSSARFAFPNSVAVDASFNVFVADTYNHTIRKITSAGVVTTIAGSAGLSGSADGNGAAARFNQPEGIAVDGSGNVYVADSFNHTIRRITSTGDVTTIAGNVGVSGSTDGSGTAVKFNAPYGIAVDSSGNLFVADTFNHTIRRSGSLVAPVIQTQPSSTTVTDGQNATLSVAATGNPPPSYQWQRQPAGTSGFADLTNGATFTGVNTATLVISGATLAMSGDQFRVLINNLVDGVVTSQAATLTVQSAQVAPTFSTQPATATTINAGDTTTLSATATGVGQVTYQWYKDGVAIPGATSVSYVIVNSQSSNAGTYTVVATNTYGSVTSNPATVTINTAPVILTQPHSQTVITGGATTLSVSASGAAGMSYQWRKNGQPISSATGATLALSNVTTNDAGGYDVIVTNSLGNTKSGLAQITVVTTATAPVFTVQPANRTVLAGSNIILTADATGVPTPTYQWRKNGTALSGATNSSLALTNVQDGDVANYDVVATNSAGSVTSSAGTLRVFARSYSGVYFGSFANGLGNFAMYIRNDNSGVFLGYLAGSNAPVMTLNVSVNDAGQFSFAQSAVASTQPADPKLHAALGAVTISGTIAADGSIAGTMTGGSSTTFSATRSLDVGSTQNVAGLYLAGAGNSGANAVTIVSATGQAFAIAQVGNATDGGLGTASAAGQIAITASRTTISEQLNPNSGSVTGSVSGAINSSFVGASELVIANQHLANISSRARVGGSGSIAIAGFVIQGTESKPVLIRAVGPTLTSFGISGALGTPKLDLYRGQTVIASNTGVATSGNAAAIAAAGEKVGAFALSSAADSAILTTLPPGNYTAQVSSSTGSSGIILVEVYDVSLAATNQKLVNISTLASTGPGDNTLIAGVVISGSTPKRVLIRAVGPGLTPFNVSGILSQPVLTLTTQSGQFIAQNTGWSTSPDAATITAAGTQVGAFPLATADSAMIVTLSPGAYSAQATGVGNTTGNTMIEVYELQ